MSVNYPCSTLSNKFANTHCAAKIKGGALSEIDDLYTGLRKLLTLGRGESRELVVELYGRQRLHEEGGSAPGLVVNDELKASGRVPSRTEIRDLLRGEES